MLSIGKMNQGQQAYYDKLASEDYYLDGGEPPGQWVGKGAEILGLTGQVQSQDFSDLFEGTLRGQKVVKDPPKGKERAPGWDLTFSATKYVSVMLSQADPEEAQKIREAQQKAVEKALSYVEEKCGFTRTGAQGRVVEKAKCVFATFEHATSRAEQPQLHTHALMINLGVRENGKTGALKTEKLYQHKMAAGAIYRAELAHQLEQSLGVEILKDGFAFKVAGVSEELCEHFSKRREEIEAKLAKLGFSSAVASANVALSTRETKGKISRQDLLNDWKKEGASMGWSTQQLRSIIGKTKPQSQEILQNQAALAAVEGIEHLMEQRSYFTEKDAVRFTCEFSQGRGVPADLALQATEEALKAEGMISLGIHFGEKHFTTEEHLRLEAQMMDDVKSLKEGKKLAVSEHAIDKAIRASADSGKPLTPDQLAAAKHILAGEGRISTVIGDAGSGKTTLLKPVAQALKESGYEVQGIALAGKAAEGMEKGSGIESGTIASFLWTQEKIKAGWNEEQAKEEFYDWVAEERKRRGPQLGRKEIFDPQWTRKAADKSYASFCQFAEKFSLGEKSVLVMDEAGMTDTKQFAQVVEIVKDAGAKLVAIGDPKQLQAIMQGGGFSGIADEVKGPRLTTIFRQEDEKEKAAVKEMGDGSVTKSLKHYAEEGRLNIAETRGEAKETLVNDWARKGISRPEENLILGARNVDVHELNKTAQESRIEAGYLKGKSIKVGAADFYEGDRVIFTKNQKSLGVKNGNFGTVRGFNSMLGTVSVELDGDGPARDRTRKVSLSKYSDMRLGYAVTTHKSQGMTVKNAFVLTDEQMIDRQMSYVQLSRVENQAKIFTTEEEAGDQLSGLVKSMSRDAEKKMALELAKRELEQKLREEQQKALSLQKTR